MERICLFCRDTVDLEADQYQFCDHCQSQLEILEVDIAEAERKLKGEA